MTRAVSAAGWVLLAFAGPILANTGQVNFAIGNVVVTDDKGQSRVVGKGTEVRTGDRITSGADGRAQIRFSDGAFVSLQPNTDFEIKSYHYEDRTDGSESAIFGLFKGALRTVTGLVGRVNRGRYQISTPTATIGIRGTGGLIQVNGDGSTLVVGTSGIWTLSNNGGTLEIPAGTSGFAGNPNIAPRPTTEQPVLPPSQAPQQPTAILQGETRDPGGGLATLPIVPLASGSGYMVGFVQGDATSGSAATLNAPADAVFDTAGRLTQFTVDPALQNTAPFGTVFSIFFVCDCLPGQVQNTFALAGMHADFGTDGVLAWGRWIGDVVVTTNNLGTVSTSTTTLSDNQGLHYVVGLPTSVSALPAGGAFTYNMIGATHPTFTDGLAAPGTLTAATFTGDFSAMTVDVKVSATAGGADYTGTASQLPIRAISATNNGAVFTGTGTGTGTGCPNGCGFGVAGFFAGNAATRAGINYGFGNTAQGSNLVGAAALAR